MATPSDTPQNSPGKCGCTGGIVVSCGSVEMEERVPGRQSKRRLVQVAKSRCPLCEDPSREYSRIGTVDNRKCDDVKRKRNPATDDVNDENEQFVGSSARRSYASLFRNALYKWNGRRRKNRRANVESAAFSVDQDEADAKHQRICDTTSNSSSNKVPQDFSPIMNENQSPREVCLPLVVARGSNQGDFHHGEEEVRRQSRDKSPRSPWGVRRVQLSTKHKNNATVTAGKREEFDRNEITSPKSSILGDDGHAMRNATVSNDNGKQRRGNYRKRLSSPIHRKESTRETVPQQSTYVSFQDDFTQDIFLNMPPRSPTTLGYVSKRFNQSNTTNNSLSKTNDNSTTTSPSDDVFLDNCIGGNYQIHETQAGGSNEDIANERIASLFQAVRSAFEKETPKTETDEVRHSASMEPNNNYHGKRTMFNFDKTVVERNESHMLHRQYQVPYNRAVTTMSDTCGGHQPIESIMASANLQASLENAMRMLQESSKLLIPGQGQSLHHSYGRHGAQQQARARTYSTCSRLETIAEENDRGEEGGTDSTQPLDHSSWYCYSDSSHQDKISPGVDNKNCQRDCDDSFSSGFCRPQHSFGAFNRPVYHGDRSQLNDSEHKIGMHMKTIQQNSYATKPRSFSTSTISVRNIHKEGENLSSATNTDSCAACDWLRQGKRRFTVTTATVVSNTDWRSILNENGYCQDTSHTQSWGLCTKKHTQPVLCHTHYLQYYQFLQTKSRPVIRRRRPTLSSASSQSDSVIDYDIKEILSSLDNFTMSDRSSANSSIGNRHSANYCQGIDDCESHYCSSIAAQLAGIGQRTGNPVQKRSSDTDVSSVNSDSAFSTNGSLTPSTRDGVITDRDSMDSTVENNMEHHYQMYSQSPEAKRSKAYSKSISFRKHGRSQGYDQSIKKGSIAEQAKRYRSLRRTKDNENNSDQRCSVISYTGSSPLDTLGDSAVHLQDNCSSYSTHLSSDSFYSSRTSFDKENYYTGSIISLAISQSSSEASLNSEGTLCLSDYTFSQQNLTFQAGSSSVLNEQFETEFTPCLSPDKRRPVLKCDSFAQWVSQASANECHLEKFMVSEDTHEQPRFKFPNSSSTAILENSAVGGKRETSSSGSSDSNTLGSVSSRSTYATSTLSSNRTQSRYNTFDSSPYVSTDDTGDTVIDQYMLRCQEKQYCQGESVQSANKMRYQPSAFHYENLDIPNQRPLEFQQYEASAERTPRSVCSFKSQINLNEVTNNETRIIIPRSRSASLSCVVTSVTKVLCITGQSKSVPCIHRSSFCELRTCVQPKEKDIEKQTRANCLAISSSSLSKNIKSHNQYTQKPSVIPSNCNHILHSKVNSMLQNCCQTETMITSLRESVKSCSNSSAALMDKKLLELDNILKQKDELINQLHNLLLFASKTKKINIGYPLGTM